MDTVALLVKVLPPCALPKLKFLVSVLGAIATSVVVTYPHADPRFAIASAALTAVCTYLTPNVPQVKLVGSVATQVEATCCQPSQEAEKPAPAPATVQTQAPAPVKEVGV